jgi:hypothetical protein
MSYLSWWGGLPSHRKNLVYLGAGIALAALGFGLQNVTAFDKQLSGMVVGAGLGACIVGVVGFFMPDLHDMGTIALRRRYYRDSCISIAGLVVAVVLLQRFGDTDVLWLRAALALFPAAMVFLSLLAYVRFVRHADELLRKIELESIGFAVLLTCTVSAATLFLQEVELLLCPSDQILPAQGIVLAASYLLARVVVSRRYQ